MIMFLFKKSSRFDCYTLYMTRWFIKLTMTLCLNFCSRHILYIVICKPKRREITWQLSVLYFYIRCVNSEAVWEVCLQNILFATWNSIEISIQERPCPTIHFPMCQNWWVAESSFSCESEQQRERTLICDSFFCWWQCEWLKITWLKWKNGFIQTSFEKER